MSKALTTAIAITMAIAALAMAGCKTDNTSNGKPVVKIGVILPLTGPVAMLGESSQNSAILALEELSAKTGYTYKAVFEDDQMNAAKSSSAINKLVSSDHVDAVITMGSSTGNVVSPIAEKAGIVHIATASDLNVAKGDTNFNNWTTPAEEAKLLVSELKKRNITNATLIALNHPGTQAVVDALESEMIHSGTLNFSLRQKHNSGEKDFRPQIEKIKNSNPQIVVVIALPPELDLFAKQYKESGAKAPLTGVEVFNYAENKAAFNGCWFVDGAEATPAFDAKYTARFKKTFSSCAPNVHDSIILLAEAYESSPKKKLSGKELAKALISLKSVTGALGPLTITPERLVYTKASLRMVQDGKIVPFKP